MNLYDQNKKSEKLCQRNMKNETVRGRQKDSKKDKV